MYNYKVPNFDVELINKFIVMLTNIIPRPLIYTRVSQAFVLIN